MAKKRAQSLTYCKQDSYSFSLLLLCFSIGEYTTFAIVSFSGSGHRTTFAISRLTRDDTIPLMKRPSQEMMPRTLLPFILRGTSTKAD